MTKRITEGIDRPEPVSIRVNDEMVEAYPGESLAAVLMVNKVQSFYKTKGGSNRAPFCNMGTCFECLVGIVGKDSVGQSRVRACMTPVEAGMCIYTGRCLQLYPTQESGQ